MARRKANTPAASKQRFSGAESNTKAATKQRSPGSERNAQAVTKQRFSGAERSVLFARREAANVLWTVLRGDAERRAVASIKSLVFSPSVRNKRATFALVCETLKHLNVIKDVLEIANVLNSKWKSQESLVYIICYDILFGKDTPSVGDAEKFLMHHKDALLSALATLLVRKKLITEKESVTGREVSQLWDVRRRVPGSVKPVELVITFRSIILARRRRSFSAVSFSQDRSGSYQSYSAYWSSKTTLCSRKYTQIDVDSAVQELEKLYTVQKDETVSDLLVLPPGSDLHAHHLVTDGRIFLQGKASSMVAAALQPEAGWEVLDACSAPGNKTVHVAALMEGQGKIIACELNEERVKRLEHTIKLSGATNIKVFHGDFLGLNPNGSSFAKVRGILLDPSCSGSGTITDRLDYLLPSHSADNMNYDAMRLHKLAVFQKRALAHALSSSSLGFELATPFPQWQRRGLPVFAGSEHLLRMDPVADKEGFFIALFTKTKILDNLKSSELPAKECRRRQKQQRTYNSIPLFGPKCSEL